MKLDHLWMVLIAAVMATFSKAEEAIEVPPCAVRHAVPMTNEELANHFERLEQVLGLTQPAIGM